MNIWMKPIATLFAGSVLTGGALAAEIVDLNYPRASDASPVEGASDVHVAVQIIDSRADKHRVGSRTNSFGVEMAAIESKRAVAEVVKDAVVAELLARGFCIDAQAPAVLIQADIHRFHTEHYAGVFSAVTAAELIMTVVVESSAGTVLFSRLIATEGVEPHAAAPADDTARRALQSALGNGVRKLAEDPRLVEALLAARSAAASRQPVFVDIDIDVEFGEGEGRRHAFVDGR